LYTSERFGDSNPFGEHECIHEIFEFARIIRASGKIAHLFDRNSSIHVEVSRDYESFVADEIIHRFDKSCFCLKIALKDVDGKVVIFDILFKEFAEFCDKFYFLNHKRIIGLEDVDSRGLGNHSLEYHYGDYERNEKNKIMEHEAGYLFIAVYDFCLYIVHRAYTPK